MIEPFPVALFGFGKIAAGFAADRGMAQHFKYASHAQVLRDHPAFDWQAVIDPSPEARHAALAEWGVPIVVAAPQELPDHVNPAVCIIATPPDRRTETVAALDSVRLAVVEKPLGYDCQSAASFLAACRARKIEVQVNFFRRADRTTRKLAAGELVEQIGEPQAASAVYGNGLRNNAIHLVDLFRMLVGEVTSVRAVGAPTPLDGAENDVQVPFTLTSDSGVVGAFLPLDFRHYREVGFELWGTRGRIEILQEGLLARISKRGQHRALDNTFEVASDHASTMTCHYGTALYELYSNAAEHLMNGTALFSPGSNALANQRIVGAVLDSAACGGAEVSVSVE